jgi:2-octaprenyl-6-methoxyphenol hydroxylase
MRPPLQARVIGAGPTGSLAALALAEAGWTVSLEDPLNPEALLARQRAYAFTHSSRRLLENIGLWDGLEPLLVPFRSLHLLDAGLQRGLTFLPDDLPQPSRLGSVAPIGWIGRHAPLMEHLLERLERHPAITLHLGGSPPREASPAPQLVVAADGPASATRTALGIGSWGWDYGQQCLTAEVELRGGEPEQAWELLRPEGPFAVLPLGNGLSQLVWSAPASRCRQLASLPPAAFLDSLMAVLPDPLEPDALRDQPRAFPVGLRLARSLSRGTTVLVGESAHRCHPVGGQGLNLCWRDVAVLHRLATRAASGSLPPHRLAAAYGRRRWPDLVLVLMATDLLVRLHSNRHPLLLPLRSVALTLLAASHPLRRLVLGVMTDGLPRLRPWRRLANLTPW